MGNISRIGNNIKSLRKSRNMTLQQLAAVTGLSTGYLSNIERNMTSPTLLNVQKICEQLHSSVSDLLERNAEEKIIIRNEDREKASDENGKVTVETVDFGMGNPVILHMTLQPGEGSKTQASWEHEFTEIGTVVSGEMIIDINGQVFNLNEGDTILVKPHTPHVFRNKSNQELLVCTWVRVWDKKDEEF